MEILHAVEDLIKIIRAHPLYDHLETVSEEEVTKLKKHYNHFMYQVKLAVAKAAPFTRHDSLAAVRAELQERKTSPSRYVSTALGQNGGPRLSC